jgi:hypothetical protein
MAKDKEDRGRPHNEKSQRSCGNNDSDYKFPNGIFAYMSMLASQCPWASALVAVFLIFGLTTFGCFCAKVAHPNLHLKVEHLEYGIN